jgi:ubiquitin carboxyl-terminal hydrolase 34
MYDFLFLLKPREAIAESVAAGNAHSTDIFPPGRVFQAKYAGLALQSRLRAQLNQVNTRTQLITRMMANTSKGIVDEKFLSNTIQLLDAALLNADLISASLAGKHDVPLASVLVSVLLSFLKGIRSHCDARWTKFIN